MRNIYIVFKLNITNSKTVDNTGCRRKSGAIQISFNIKQARDHSWDQNRTFLWLFPPGENIHLHHPAQLSQEYARK